MSKRTKSRPSARRKKAAAPAAKAAETPHPLAEPDTLFDCGIPRDDLTLLQMVRAMFEDCRVVETGNPAADFLSAVLLANADEAELMRAAIAGSDGLDHSEAIDRAALRAEWRSMFAVEIAKRVENGEVLR